MTLIEYHLSPRSNGEWAITKRGSRRASFLHPTLSWAWEHCLTFAQRGPIRIYLHRADGTVYGQLQLDELPEGL